MKKVQTFDDINMLTFTCYGVNSSNGGDET